MLSLHDDGPYPPCPTPFDLAAHVLAAGLDRPDHPALILLHPDGADDVWTYERLRRSILGTAQGLRAIGAAQGDRILLRLGNTPDFPILFLGCIAAGLVPVPTSSLLTGPEITAMARSVAPALVIADKGLALPEQCAPVLSLRNARRFHDLPPLAPVPGDPDRPAYIVFTSGTSGQPRAVVHAHRAIWARGMMRSGWDGLGPDDRLLHAGAFNWTYTLGTGLLDPWRVGATALIPAPGTPATAVPGLLARAHATIFAAAPGIYRQMLRAPVPPLPALRHGLSAGEKLSPGLAAAWTAATGSTVHEAYGMSECSTFLSGSPSRPAPPGTLGYPQPGRRVAVLANGVPVPRGAPGTIAVHRSDPGLMLGYHDQPGDTAARMAGDWFLTGDIGIMEDDGAIAYLGRDDDMMNAGGIRVSPVEVEAVLAAHPGIADVAACEVRIGPDTTVIAAFWCGPDDIAPDALAVFAARGLARYKCPRLYVRHDALPRGANHKLLRRQLRRDWEAANGHA